MTRTGWHQWLMRRWYGPEPMLLLVPFSWLFMLLTAIRRAGYRFGIFKSTRLPAPVIVVGNITVGGTGKTPLVIWLSQALQARGYRPGIVTRGYGGKSKHWPLPVTATTAAALAGDEAVLLARATGLPVMAGPDRMQAARQLLHDQAVNVIVSDDGLQHYRLGRDLQIVTLDGERGCGNGWRLPAGPLRESTAAIKKADVVVCKSRLPAGIELPPHTPVMHMNLLEAVRLHDGLRVPLANFRGRSVHSIAGIGHPEQFFALLAAAGIQVEPHPLPDHAALTRRELQFDDQRPVLMTEKDAVRWAGLDRPNLWYVPAHAEFSRVHAADLMRAVEGCLAVRGAAG
ncbi:MAG: tetraacyldisaccharide 4'-kinase [Gammaproteobacteria bacterium]|nr:tetraacyldisaccharide 4'-kinase [Gammaproteobacteria bacterium]